MTRKVSVTGGKGGTGKSTIAVNLALELACLEELVLADLDVEAPNDHIILGVKLEGEEPVTIMLPVIDYAKCSACGACAEICDTGAIIAPKGRLPMVMPRLCSGCRACMLVCPNSAIREGKRIIGFTYKTPISLGGRRITLVTGMLREGEEHVSPVVVAGRRRAESVGARFMLVDTAAGTGNTVSIALEGSKLAIAVTEPTPLGEHDLELILELLGEMNIETWVVVNRTGIGSEENIRKIASQHGARVIARIPYSRSLLESYVSGVPIVLRYPQDPVSLVFRKIAKEIAEVV